MDEVDIAPRCAKISHCAAQETQRCPLMKLTLSWRRAFNSNLATRLGHLDTWTLLKEFDERVGISEEKTPLI